MKKLHPFPSSVAICISIGLAFSAQAQSSSRNISVSPLSDNDMSLTQMNRASMSIFRAGDASSRTAQVFGSDVSQAMKSRLAIENNDQAMSDSLNVIWETVNNDDGSTSAMFGQRVDGKRVYGSYAKSVLSSSGELIFSSHKLSSPSLKRGDAPRISTRRALRAAINENHPGAPVGRRSGSKGNVTSFNAGDYFFKEPTVEKVYFENDGQLQHGFLVESWSVEDNMLYETLVDRSGSVVSSMLRTQSDRIRYYVRHPDAGGSRVRDTPNRWTSGTQNRFRLSGPNVSAYLDADANNSPDAAGTVINNGEFTISADLSRAPTVGRNRRAAIQNLFYWNNVAHDFLNARGFTRSFGNFEGSDAVLAEAQDGSGVNNANFATPATGSPRMQMFLWNLTNPGRDGDLDSDIIWHEYGHGVTWRMVGSMFGSVAGALGEANSDIIAILFTSNDVVGEYSTNNANGIRSSRYQSHPDTFADFNTARGVHRNGEIYAAALWEVRREYRAAGINNRREIMGDLVRGYRFTPPQPTYLEMRDGLLQAAAADRDCLIWAAFARKGMGTGATMSVSGISVSVTESFSVPSQCT